MKITKKIILENTESVEFSTSIFGRKFSHYYQHKNDSNDYESFESNYYDGCVYRHRGPNTKIIGYATTKKEFINIVFSYIKNKKLS